MAEADTDPPNAMDDEDLEDGEIETDEEIEEPVKPAPKVAATEAPVTAAAAAAVSAVTDQVKKSKLSDDDLKKATDTKAKGDNRKSTQDNNTKKQKLTTNDIAKDDWAGDVEQALAMALKKDGIAPKPVKIIPKPVEVEKPPKVEKELLLPPQKEAKPESSSSSKSSKHKRKHKSDKESQRKKAKLAVDDGERTYHSNESDEFMDEYEMMNVRGGSPVMHGGSQKQMYYDSDASFSSMDSESGDHRRRHRSKRRTNERGSRRNHRSGNSKHHKRRRGDDSDDENMGSHGNNIGGGGGGGGGGGDNNRGNNNRGNNNNNQPRKAELCKFYLMECCAKGEKCLYMHGDFPCKFYYLGMKNHNRENCKFSHGRPLSDQLRAVLLKHLETAPKEILGDFPRIARENAINMLNAQHQKLMAKFGMDVETNSNSSNSQGNNRLPSLLDINLSKYQPPPPPSSSNIDMSMGKKEKPRKSRWCDQRSNESDSHSQANTNNSVPAGTALTNENDIKLSSLTGTLTAEQVERLSKMGIETLSQITQLTVLQVIELGLSIALISELQLKAVQIQQNKQKAQQQQQQQTQEQRPKSQKQHHHHHHQQQQQQSQSSQSSAMSESQNPFSPSSNDISSQDQDMRIPLNSTTTNANANDKLVELANQDVDMRILPIPHRTATASEKSNKFKKTDSDSFSNNTQLEKTNEQASSRKLIDYSQYLKDANIDLNQSDLEDPIGESLHKEKKKSYDSDEDEANPLIIEEEDLSGQHDDSQSENDKDDERERSSLESIGRHGSPRNADDALNTLPSPDSNSDPANSNDDHILPAFYAPTSIFPPSVTNKIDLSSSVSQYLKKKSDTSVNDSVEKTDSYVTKSDNDLASEPHDDNDSTGSRSPPGRPTSFYSRLIPETSHPAPQALDEKPSPSVDYDSASELNTRNHCSSPAPAKPVRKSIYEMSSDDEDNREDDSIRSPSDDDSQDSRKQNPFALSGLSKDKDMRISAMFMDKDYSNGDIDLRLPFKPVMANYIPATEIDASITSHAPMTYEVKEVEIPKPDYSELRKSIPSHENTLDPRLRRILRIKDDYPSESESNFALNAKASPFSPPHEPESTISTMSTVSDPRRQRVDPRRPNAHLINSNTTTSNAQTGGGAQAPSSVLNKSQQPQRSVHLDIQNILQKSNWYKDLSSKQKIIVNQQMAIVSTELKKFNADPSENKIFDLKFINQNPLLQEVLTNLGIFISDDGEFVQLDQPTMMGGGGGGGVGGGKDVTSMQARSTDAALQQNLVDLMSIPIEQIEYIRNQQQQQQDVVAQHQQQQQQQAAALQAQINAMGGPRFLNAAATTAAQQMLSFGSLPVGDVIRPGILGMAPNMQLNDAFNLLQSANQNAPFYNQRAGGGGGGGNSGNSGGGNRRTGGGGGGGGNRRNQFDRNNSRRK